MSNCAGWRPGTCSGRTPETRCKPPRWSTSCFSNWWMRTHEAKTIAALNHPNICQIYDVGPNYLVMELVHGGPIVSPDRPHPLAANEAVRLAVQIAAALEAAHSKGIIHRDLKPANILATGGLVKLLDFGLAKQSAPSSTDD